MVVNVRKDLSIIEENNKFLFIIFLYIYIIYEYINIICSFNLNSYYFFYK